MSTATLDTPPSNAAAPVVPENTGMGAAALAKMFPTETPAVADPVQTDATVTKEVKSEPVAKEEPKSFLKVASNTPDAAPVVAKEPASTEKPKSVTAQKFDEQRAKHETELKEIAAQRDEMKAKAFDLENELTSLREKASTLGDYEEIKRKNKEFEEVITRLNIQELPEFKQKYTVQETEIYTRLTDVLEGTENKDKIIAALKMAPSAERDAKLDELQEGLGLTKIAKVAQYAARLDELSSNKKLEIDNSDIARRLYLEDQTRKEGEQKTQQEKVFDHYSKYFSENDPTYKKREGDDAFNQNIDHRLAQARQLYFEANDDQRAQITLAAMDRPILLQLVQTLSSELKIAQQAATGKLEATPGVGATRKDEPVKPTTAMEAFKQAIGS